MLALSKLLGRLASESACLVTLEESRGSVPREKGAWMAVFGVGEAGTIGGGHLEYSAMAEARQRLSRGCSEALVRYALGPSLGQCCGGEVHLRFQLVTAADIEALRLRLATALQPVALFGGGHVGRALVEVLTRLPLAVSWIDSRDEIFPANVPANVICQHSDPVQGAVASLASGSYVLIMSFSHAEDLDVLASCLLRQRERADLPYIGLIGSGTKWATFSHRLVARGFSATELAQVTCPIGIPGISSKEPEVIALAVAAQLMQTMEREENQPHFAGACHAER